MFMTFSDAKLLIKLGREKEKLTDAIYDEKEILESYKAELEKLSDDKSSREYRNKRKEVEAQKDVINGLIDKLTDITMQIKLDAIDAVKKVDQETGKVVYESTNKTKPVKTGLFKKEEVPVKVPNTKVHELEEASEEEIREFLNNLEDDFATAKLNKKVKEDKEKKEEKAKDTKFRNEKYYLIQADDGYISVDGDITRKIEEVQLFKNESAAISNSKFYEKQYDDIDVIELPSAYKKRISKDQVDDSEVDTIENKKRSKRLSAEKAEKEKAKAEKENKKKREEFLSKSYWVIDIQTQKENGMLAYTESEDEDTLTDDLSEVIFFESPEAARAYIKYIKETNGKLANCKAKPSKLDKEENEELTESYLYKLSGKRYRAGSSKRFRRRDPDVVSIGKDWDEPKSGKGRKSSASDISDDYEIDDLSYIYKQLGINE